MDWLDTLRRTFLDFGAMWEVFPQLFKIGLKNTLIISVAATAIGLVLGMLVAVMGISTSRWLRIPARIYTDVFRGLPAILTILLIGQGLGRFKPPPLRPAAVPVGDLALRLDRRPFHRGNFRRGNLRGEKGQLEACRALAMSYPKAMRLV